MSGVTFWGIVSLVILGTLFGMLIMAALNASEARALRRRMLDAERAQLIQVDRARAQLYNIARRLYINVPYGTHLYRQGVLIQNVADDLSQITTPETTTESEPTK